MGLVEADQLQGIIERAAQKPIWANNGFHSIGLSARLSRASSTSDLATWVAFRENDRATLKAQHPGGWPRDRQYRVDSLAERISQAYSDLLFGEDPVFEASADAGENSTDQEHIDEIVKANNLPSELRRAAADCSSEGEVWWRVYNDPAEGDYPTVEFASRLDVIPLFRGRKLVAAAFVTQIESQEIESDSDPETKTWRLVEIQTDLMVRNLLYLGSSSGLGSPLTLDQHDDTANILPEWNHGIPQMLAGRVINKAGRDHRLGLSDYDGIKDQLFDLNEARTIMAENARLAAKKRAAASRKLVGADGTVDLGSDLFIVDESAGVDDDLGDKVGKTVDFAILEYTFDSEALIAHIRELVGTAVTRAGLVEQMVNTASSTDGGGNGASDTGVALRTRLIPQTLSAAGKARHWDDEIGPRILLALQRVSALDVANGGSGHQWKAPDAAPNVIRTSILPEDEDEKYERHASAVGAEIESIFTAVTELHPDWEESDVLKEVKRIRDDRGSFGNPDDDDEALEAEVVKTKPGVTPVKVEKVDGDPDEGA